MSIVRKVMVVDDARVVRMALRGIMKKMGWEVVEAADGREAVAQLEEHPDLALILLDWHMPEMNGYDFLVYLRSKAEFSEHPKVIMVTTEASMPSMLQALAAGADEYIMKPFDADMIASKLEQVGIVPQL